MQKNDTFQPAIQAILSNFQTIGRTQPPIRPSSSRCLEACIVMKLLKNYLLGLPIASNGEKLLFKSDTTAVLHASTWHLTKEQSLETTAALTPF